MGSTVGNYEQGIHIANSAIARCDAQLELAKRIGDDDYASAALSGVSVREFACQYPEAFDLSDEQVGYLQYALEYPGCSKPPRGNGRLWLEEGNRLAEKLEDEYDTLILPVSALKRMKKNAVARRARYRREMRAKGRSSNG